MHTRRRLARFWRRLRRPSLTRLAVASLALHVGVLALLAWLGTSPWGPLPPTPAPLIVDLPPAEAGRPLVRPETPTRPAPPPGPAARPAPAPRPAPPRARPAPPALAPAPAPAPAAPPPPPAVARAPEPPPAPPLPAAPPPPPAPLPAPPTPAAPPPPPVVARAPEPAPEPAPAPPPPPPLAAPAPAPAPRPPAAPPTEATGPSTARVSPPAAAPPPAPAAPARPPSEGGGAPTAPGAPGSGTESPFSSRVFSLLRPRLDVPLPRLPGGGGTRTEGEGAGDGGDRREGGRAIPLNKPPDEDYADYFLKVKKAIEEHWSYPTDAARRGQSGQLVLEFVIHKDGHVNVELVRSSGIDVLDRYAVNAVKFASPYPALPARLGDALRISASFTYVLDHGFRVFGLQ